MCIAFVGMLKSVSLVDQIHAIKRSVFCLAEYRLPCWQIVFEFSMAFFKLSYIDGVYGMVHAHPANVILICTV